MPDRDSTRRHARWWLGRAALHAVPLALLWIVLTGGHPASWLIGAPAVAASAAAAAALRPHTRWPVTWAGLARFIPYFLRRSLDGGLDVALRAMHPRLPIDPLLHDYPVRLPPEGPSRVLFANTMNLLPGTLSARLHGDVVTVHLLTGGPEAIANLRQLEERVADVFGVELEKQGLRDA